MLKFLISHWLVVTALSFPSYGMEQEESDSPESYLSIRLKKLGQQKDLSLEERKFREKGLNDAYAKLKTLRVSLVEFETRLPQPLGQQIKKTFTRFRDAVAQWAHDLTTDTSEDLVISEVLGTNMQDMNLDDLEDTFPGLMISLSTKLAHFRERVAELSLAERDEHEKTLAQFDACFLDAVSGYQKHLRALYENPNRLSTDVSHELRAEHDLATSLLRDSTNNNSAVPVSTPFSASPNVTKKDKKKDLEKSSPGPDSERDRRSTLDRLKEKEVVVETPIVTVTTSLKFKSKLDLTLKKGPSFQRQRNNTFTSKVSAPSSPPDHPKGSPLAKTEGVPLLKRSNTDPSKTLPKPMIGELKAKINSTGPGSPGGQSSQPQRLTLEQESMLVDLVRATTGVGAMKKQLSSQEKVLLKLLQQMINGEQ